MNRIILFRWKVDILHENALNIFGSFKKFPQKNQTFIQDPLNEAGSGDTVDSQDPFFSDKVFEAQEW